MPKTACPVVWEGPGAQSLVTRPDKKILTQIGKRHQTEDFHNKAAKAAKTEQFGYEVAVFRIKPLWPLWPCCELFCSSGFSDSRCLVHKDGQG
jgi:hypothetical protein